MAIDPGCNSKISYTGDGVQTEFTYPFTTIEDEALYVAVWDELTAEYNNVTDWVKDGGLIRFDTAPEADVDFIIYRLTDVDPVKAIFHPGHPVKAGDLNINFEQLSNAIEDTRCLLEKLPEVERQRFWSKVDETVYSEDEWLHDDVHVATTKAIAERHDVLFLNQGELAPYTDKTTPGKFMITADNSLFAWNGSQWFQPIAGGLTQAGESTSQHTSITTSLPIASTYHVGSNRYGLTFSIGALNQASTVENEDVFIIERGGVQYKANSSILKDTYTTNAYVGESPPPPPYKDGDLWWSTIEGSLYVFYDDGISEQWVDASPSVNIDDVDISNFVLEAPDDGRAYVRQNKDWTEVANTGGGGGGSSNVYTKPLVKNQYNVVSIDLQTLSNA